MARTSAEPMETTAPGPKSRRKKAPRGSGHGKKRKHVDLKKDIQSAEAVLPDARMRDTRTILLQGCQLETEQINHDKAFDDETKRLGKALNVTDNSSQELREDDKDEKARKKKKKKDEEVKEKFNNEKKEADSPNAKSPEASSTMLEEMDFELRVMELTHVKKLTVWTLASVLMSNFYRLPIFLILAKYYVSYGISFVGLCGVLMAFIGIPVIFLEISMGQFTSLPPNTFFARICPIAEGIGYSMIIVRTFAILCIHIDLRYIFLFFQHLTTFMSPKDERCKNSGMPFCSTTGVCGQGENGLYGNCVNVPNGYDVPFKDQVLLQVANIRGLQTSPNVLLSENEMNEHNVYIIFTQLLVSLVAGIPLIDGAELFSAIAPCLMVLSFLTPVIIFWNLESNAEFSTWRGGWNGGMDAFSDPYAWIVAFCLMCSMFNAGEGTWMFIGSWLNFRHKQVFRTLVYTVVAQLILMFFMSFAFSAWAMSLVSFQHNGYLSYNEAREILNDRPLEFWLTLPIKLVPDGHKSIMFLVYLLFALNSMGYMITSGEYILVSLIRGFSFLVRIPKVQLRSTVLLIMNGISSIILPFFLDYQVFSNPIVHYTYILLLLFVIMYEMTIFIYVYGLQRILMNLKVLFRVDPQSLIIYSRLAGYLKLCYRFILSWFIMAGIAYTSSYVECNITSFFGSIMSITLACPFIVGFYKMSRHSETTHSLMTLFRPDTRFGPSAAADRKQAVAEEIKMGSYGLH